VTESLRILLTESVSASAREAVTVLTRRGHKVGVLEPKRDGLLQVTRRVSWRHPVPAFGADPVGYLSALQDVLRSTEYDVVLPIHEQVAVLSRYPDALSEFGVGFAAPPFESLARVQNKASAVRLLTSLGVPQPPTELVSSVDDLRAADFPCYVKLPVATGSRGVWFVSSRESLSALAERPEVADTFGRGWPVLVQKPVDGQFAMMAAVFDRGSLVAAHAVLRVHEGVQGSAAAKESVVLPSLQRDIAALGAELSWHGAISFDAIIDEAGVARVIDINPRLVEPVNAELSGTDLIGRLLAVSLGEPTSPAPAGAEGTRTHMALMALLRHGEIGNRRRDVLAELWNLVARRGRYAGSAEELLPAGWDPPSALPVLIVSAMMVANPRWWNKIAKPTQSSVTLSPDAWELLGVS
jgi:predicted ATP-grasp superfamily ATP-dependent carboligase